MGDSLEYQQARCFSFVSIVPHIVVATLLVVRFPCVCRICVCSLYHTDIKTV
jgi:hypothetical protein